MSPTRSGRKAAGSITIDLEDWKCALDPSRSSTRTIRPMIDIEYLRDSTHRLLTELSESEAKATFFVLGEVAQALPELIEEIHDKGHEIGSHSPVHLPPRMIPRDEFRRMLAKDSEVLTEITGERPIGFRAPYFGVRRDEGWILEILSKCGFIYDSSIVPTWTPYWGIPFAPKTPYYPDLRDLSRRQMNGSILEIPITVWPSFDIIPGLPIGGGFYMRAWPLHILIKMMKMNVSRGHHLVLYVHPGNLDSRKDMIEDITFRDRITQYIGANRGPLAFHQILNEFSFDTMSEVFSESINRTRSEKTR